MKQRTIHEALSARVIRQAEMPTDEMPRGRKARVLCITPGVSANNGRVRFPEACLREAVPLFDGRPVKLDHPGMFGDRSPLLHVGRLSEAAYEHGVACDLDVLAESGTDAVRLTMARLALEPETVELSIFAEALIEDFPEMAPDGAMGECARIVRVMSVDIVDEAARGGRVLDVMQSVDREDEMTEIERLQQERDAALAELKTAQTAQTVAQVAARIAESDLPEAARARVRAHFAGQIATDQDIQREITEHQALVRELSQGMARGPEQAGAGAQPAEDAAADAAWMTKTIRQSLGLGAEG